MNYLRVFILFLLVLNLYSNDKLPKRYHDHKELLYLEISELTNGDFPLPPYFASLIEQETCYSITHKLCWNPKAKLHTKRELGGGLGQLTKAYNKYGKLRFDTLTRLKLKYPEYLKELTWNNLWDRVDLQIKAVILLYMESYNKLDGTDISYFNKLAFSDSAYNGGFGALYRDMKYCKLIKGCDHTIWFDNVETHSKKSRKKLYGNRSPYSINRTHVKNVMRVRLNKYIDDWLDIIHESIE